jgi:hypothetical protein
MVPQAVTRPAISPSQGVAIMKPMSPLRSAVMALQIGACQCGQCTPEEYVDDIDAMDDDEIAEHLMAWREVSPIHQHYVNQVFSHYQIEFAGV